jgi:hypothetical protein
MLSADEITLLMRAAKEYKSGNPIRVGIVYTPSSRGHIKPSQGYTIIPFDFDETPNKGQWGMLWASDDGDPSVEVKSFKIASISSAILIDGVLPPEPTEEPVEEQMQPEGIAPQVPSVPGLQQVPEVPDMPNLPGPGDVPGAPSAMPEIDEQNIEE